MNFFAFYILLIMFKNLQLINLQFNFKKIKLIKLHLRELGLEKTKTNIKGIVCDF